MFGIEASARAGIDDRINVIMNQIARQREAIADTEHRLQIERRDLDALRSLFDDYKSIQQRIGE